ncbi:MAG TPA: hypothetical protein VFW23_05200 [Tepidisphaeraceae bacterium]|nr:hypothetical protein [Tepidisphaeraceae bacterium]
MKAKHKSDELTGEKFDAMSPAERQKIIDEIERISPEKRWGMSKPPTRAERRKLDRIAKKLGRPKIGNGTRNISITVEIDLLKRAEAYSRRKHMKRSEVFSLGLMRLLKDANGTKRKTA